MRGTVLVAVVLVVLMAGMVTDAQARMGWETLKGHKAMQVLVAAIVAEKVKPGLDRESIKTKVEQRFRRDGITVSSSPTSVFHVIVTVNCPENLPVCASNVHTEFWQRAVLLDVPGRPNNPVVTWSLGFTGIAGTPRFPQYVYELLTDVMDSFISDWLRANPTR